MGRQVDRRDLKLDDTLRSLSIAPIDRQRDRIKRSEVIRVNDMSLAVDCIAIPDRHDRADVCRPILGHVGTLDEILVGAVISMENVAKRIGNGVRRCIDNQILGVVGVATIVLESDFRFEPEVLVEETAFVRRHIVA